MNRNPFITIFLVVICATTRILSWKNEYLNIAVAIINIFMLAYVFYIISAKTNSKLKERSEKNNIFSDQYERFRAANIVFWIIFLLLALIYIVFLSIISTEVGSCINDCIAFGTFGLSLEEDYLFQKVSQYYIENNFIVKKAIKRENKER